MTATFSIRETANLLQRINSYNLSSVKFYMNRVPLKKLAA